MRHIKYFALLLAIITMGCVDDFESLVHGTGETVRIVGRVLPFADRDVDTRATKVDPKEYEAKTIDLLIFDKDNICVYHHHSPNGDMVFSVDKGTLNADGTVNGGDFVGVDQTNLDACKIVIVANIPELEDSGFGVGSRVDQFSSISTAVKGIDIPSTGIPMVGEYAQTVNLKAGSGVQSAPIEVQMKALYAKVVFDVNVEANEVLRDENGKIIRSPQFVVNGFKVTNLVDKVDFVDGEESKEKMADGTNDTTPILMSGDKAREFNGAITGSNTAYDRGSAVSFSFYVPERYLRAQTAANDYAYPFKKDGTIRDEDMDLRQRYKPEIAQESATYCTINGVYTDHNGNTFDVNYKIYLGNDNYSNFDVVRNCQYNNTVTIKGILNSDDQSTNEEAICIDHRVNVNRTLPVIVNLRLETMLDAHFEVRPLRIRTNTQDGSTTKPQTVKVEVLSVNGGSAPDWIRLERSFGVTDRAKLGVVANSPNKELYCDSAGSSTGKRKYFTWGLVSGTAYKGGTEANNISRNTSVEVPLTKDGECVWIYVDECTEASTNINAVRRAKIRVRYGDGENDYRDYFIAQHKLFELTYEGRTYHIEHEEEYLHNFDSEDTFVDNFTEEEGIVWGLYNAQLSFDHDALSFNIENLGWFDFVNRIVDAIRKSAGVSPKYDFYIESTFHDAEINGGVTKHIRDGYNFFSEIITDINTKNNSERDTKYEGVIGDITLAQRPSSAIEYVYNRNKRNSDGKVVSVDWYLPAIDEMEDIMMGGHEYFKDFLEKYYWSCQPSYLPNHAWYDVIINMRGTYYVDDTGNYEDSENQYKIYNNGFARATKTIYLGGDDYDYFKSGTSGYDNAVRIYNFGYSKEKKYIGSYDNRMLEDWSTADFESIDRHDGNFERSTKHRVRAVRKITTTN